MTDLSLARRRRCATRFPELRQRAIVRDRFHGHSEAGTQTLHDPIRRFYTCLRQSG